MIRCHPVSFFIIMSSTSANKKVILAKTVDWNVWFFYIKAKDHSNEIWDLIDSNLIIRSTNVVASISSMLNLMNALNLKKNAAINAVAYEKYKVASTVYKQLSVIYKEQQKTLNVIIILIQDTIFTQCAEFIVRDDLHFWNYFRTFKQQFALSDEVKNLKIETKYHQLCKKFDRQNMDIWLQNWMIIYDDATKYKIEEAIENKSVKDFFKVIKFIALNFFDYRLMQMTSGSLNDVDMKKLIEDFRQFVRIIQSTDKFISVIHSAFAVNQNEQSKSSKRPSSSRQSSGTSWKNESCFCLSSNYESFVHKTNNCHYLREEFRSKKWISETKFKARIDKVMLNKDYKEKIKKSIKEFKEIIINSKSNFNYKGRNRNKGNDWGRDSDDQSKNGGNQQNARDKSKENQSNDQKVFFIVHCIGISKIIDGLLHFWILNDETNDHVCNKIMRHRFVKQKENSGILKTKTQKLFIKTWKIIFIILQTLKEFTKIILLNVVYVVDYLINIICQDRLTHKNFFFDNWKMHLHEKERTFAWIIKYENHYFLKDNTKNTFNLAANVIITNVTSVSNSESSSNAIKFKISFKTATVYEWHQMLDHVFKDAISHFSTFAEEVKISDANFNIFNLAVPVINQCESCILVKIHRIVFRFFDNAESFFKFFHRIIFDLMQLNADYNKDEWVSHITCHVIDFNMVFTHRKKSDVINILIRALNIIEIKYNGKIVFFRNDGEKALKSDFDAVIIKKRISTKSSTPNTSAQNGHFERKKRILAMKSKAIHIEDNLSFDLWSEIIFAVDYLVNKTLMKKHAWKIFYELIIDNFSNLNHLHLYDCKTYSLNKHIFRKVKMQIKTHIGHLIEYDVKNIFRIWILNQRKIIKIKNVMFDD